jgi:hypothetical protein
MRKWTSFLVIGLLFATPAWGQVNPEGGVEKGTWELGVKAGLSVPLGDYKDFVDPGLTLAVPIGYYVSPKFALGAEMGASWTGASDSAQVMMLREEGIPLDAEIKPRLYRLCIYGRYRFGNAPVAPYLLGVVGFYLQQTKVVSGVSQTFNDGYFGGGLGLGVSWVFEENVKAYVEGLFQDAGRSGNTPLSILDLRLGMAFLL